MARIGKLAIGAAGGAVLGRGHEEAAAAAADVLGNLRGLAAKIGQMASYVDGLVPEDKRDAFETSLKVLRSQAPRSSSVQIRELVETELGAPIDQLFASWNDDPIASASIGQVHHAVLKEGDGVEVAVKVQHPGIRRAVESDLSSAGVLEGIASMTGARRFDTKTQLEVIRTRFREELDYELEATRLELFAKVHEGDPKIRIPRLIASHSSKSVLTTEFVRGEALEDVITRSEEERRAFAETLWRFVFKGNLVGGMFNADPHPGNYLFHSNGEITFLDYGCVQVIPEERRPDARALHRAAVQQNDEEFGRCVSKLLNAKPGDLERRARAYTRLCFKPLFDQPFHITRSYAASLVDEMKTMALAARKTPKEEFFSLPPEMLFMNRLQFGFYSVLARLDVETNYAAVESAFLPAD